MAPNIRVAKAFRAMREIGIIEEKVKPVLKNLLKLYDKKWELIEEENYRALADAIFDKEEESQVKEQEREKERADVRDMKEEAHVNGEPERPVKRLRKNQEDQLASPSVGNPSSLPNGTFLMQPKEEVVELPEDTSEGSHHLSCPPLVRKKGKQPMLPDPSPNTADRTPTLAINGTGSGSLSPTTRRREKGKGPILSPSPDRPTPVVCLKEPKIEPGIVLSTEQQANNSKVLTKPKDEPVTDDVQQLAVPLAAIDPEPLDTADSPLPRDSSRNMSTSREALTREIIRRTSINDIQNQQNAALDVTDKANGPVNGSINLEHFNEVAQTLVPTQILSSNGNSSSTTLKETDKHISEVDQKGELNGREHVNSHYDVVQQHLPTANEGRLLHNIIDIANGQERVVISVVNEVNDECPPFFRYIPQNVVYQNAYVNFSLARIGENCCSACSGDCLSSPTPCACANESGGEYVYTSEGLVKEDILKESISMNRDPENHCQFYCIDCPLERSENNGTVERCQGHLMRRFIKECWRKCGCDNQCGNRVVQRGITRKLQVFMTPEGKGWGLRTLEDLPEGAFVCEYVGEILTNAELFERVSQTSSGEVHSYPVLLDADWAAEGVLKDEEALCLDATHYGNVARFVNHRCVDSNMVEIPVEVETPDHHYYHLAFFTTREVKALEELTWDYGINFDDKRHPVKAFKCRCGSKLCRNLKRSNKTKSRSGRRR